MLETVNEQMIDPKENSYVRVFIFLLVATL